MAGALSNLNSLELFYAVCAVVGAIFVLIRFILQFVGADAGIDTDIDATHLDADASFNLLSLHGITSFFMMFGLVGLALYRQSRVGPGLSVAGAVAAGLASVWLIGRIFALVLRLQSSGTLETTRAVGSEGTVYLHIPPGGTGRVTINFQDHLREFDAVARDGAELPTGAPVRVAQVRGGVLVVESIQP